MFLAYNTIPQRLPMYELSFLQYKASHEVGLQAVVTLHTMIQQMCLASMHWWRPDLIHYVLTLQSSALTIRLHCTNSTNQVLYLRKMNSYGIWYLLTFYREQAATVYALNVIHAFDLQWLYTNASYRFSTEAQEEVSWQKFRNLQKMALTSNLHYCLS